MATPDTTHRFIEQMGLAAEQDRLPRIAGRIMALLLLEESPLTLDDIAKRLQVSRASVSTDTRLLQSMGIVERVAPLGTRRDHFQIAAEPGREVLRMTARQLHERSRMLKETRQALRGKPAAVKKRLADLERFYSAIGRGIEGALGELNGRSS